jgi:hypothetical protein
MTTSIHDHRIQELTIQAPERMIRLRTVFPDIAGPAFAEVVFEGVEGYVFQGDVLGTILFDIEQVEALALYREHAIDMQRIYSQNGGHEPWVENEVTAAAFLSHGDVKGYQVSSSIGLEAAVWARRLTIRTI